MHFFILLMTLTIIFPFKANAKNQTSYITNLKCDDIQSQIFSTCKSANVFSKCASQEWHIKEKVIELKYTEISAKKFRVYKWACLPSNEGEVLVFYATNTGNCDTCERLSIWNSYGIQLANWENFSEKYHQLGLPDVKGEKFHRQFTPVNLRGNN